MKLSIVTGALHRWGHLWAMCFRSSLQRPSFLKSSGHSPRGQNRRSIGTTSSTTRNRERPPLPTNCIHGNVIELEFDYNTPAELHMPKRKGIGRRPAASYRRFPTAAEAIRFAVEEFPALRTLGAWMQVGDQRYDSDEIRRLYESSKYPLRRAPT